MFQVEDDGAYAGEYLPEKSGAVKFSGSAITVDGSNIKFKASKTKKKGG
ncbi:hypothetical protein STIAU_8789 [Stigmatella aurantiaca DW4/3-1]|uniref:Uncharacterized protein n=1 Tax=Stigmatella aurantiaca (strain DW4/3-1) TaxID=378806 RepID=Q09A25_STIAD|nr:hypothetical protein STIAU_8789 [Stigmatella aurantiaca DW4/3-1]